MSAVVLALILGAMIGYCFRVAVTTHVTLAPEPEPKPAARPRRRKRPPTRRSPLDSLEFTVLSHKPIEPEELGEIGLKLSQHIGHRCVVNNVTRPDYPELDADGWPLRGIAMNPESWLRAGSYMDQISQRALDARQ